MRQLLARDIVLCLVAPSWRHHAAVNDGLIGAGSVSENEDVTTLLVEQ